MFARQVRVSYGLFMTRRLILSFMSLIQLVIRLVVKIIIMSLPLIFSAYCYSFTAVRGQLTGRSYTCRTRTVHASYTCRMSLQLCTGEDTYVAAPPIAGTVLVNIGDLMQRWTGDKLRSTVRHPTGQHDTHAAPHRTAPHCTAPHRIAPHA